MRQRLSLAAALLGEPRHLILDEPVNGLDPDGITWLRSFLASYAKEGRTVFLSSHLISEMSLIADRVVVIGRGQTLADSETSTLLAGVQRTVRVHSTNNDLLRDALVSAGGIVNATSAALHVAEFLLLRSGG